MPADANRRRCSSRSFGSTMWKAFWPQANPSSMNGSSTRYSSSGLWKKAQTCRCAPSTEPANRMGWSLLLGAPPRTFALSLVGSMGLSSGKECCAWGAHRCILHSEIEREPRARRLVTLGDEAGQGLCRDDPSELGSFWPREVRRILDLPASSATSMPAAGRDREPPRDRG